MPIAESGGICGRLPRRFAAVPPPTSESLSPSSSPSSALPPSDSPSRLASLPFKQNGHDFPPKLVCKKGSAGQPYTWLQRDELAPPPSSMLSEAVQFRRQQVPLMVAPPPPVA